MGTAKMPDVVNGYHWELYNSTEDYSQYNDLAASNPAKLEELKALFLTNTDAAAHRGRIGHLACC